MRSRWLSMLAALCFASSAGAQYSVRAIGYGVETVDVVGRRPSDGQVFVVPPSKWSALDILPAWILHLASTTPVVHQGQTMPAGEVGVLRTSAYVNPASIDGKGRIAFFSQVDGAERNQGIFFADDSHLKVIAMGCGDGGGSGSTADCGDPSPVGGNFSGMFLGTTLAPTANENGDILFMSDVANGSSPRGLFLYQSSTQEIVTIAAVGDASPRGGVLTAVGPGSINNHRTIAFLASTDGAWTSDILVWRNGVVTKYAAVGDQAPGGGTFVSVGNEVFGYEDGTYIPGGPAPAINDSDEIAFSAFTQTTGGELLSKDGLHRWQVRIGDPAPGGGVFFDFREAPVLNGRGELAFNAYVADSVEGPVTGGGWFVGSHGEFRRALGFYDQLEDGVVHGLAFSRNPFHPLDDEGNLAIWASRQLADGTELGTLVIARPNGAIDIVAREGDVSETGGTWGWIDGWPSVNNASQIQFGAAVVGNPTFTDAQFIAPYPADYIFLDGFELPR